MGECFTPQDVANWLKENFKWGKEYEKYIIDEDIDGDLLSDLDAEDLNKIGDSLRQKAIIKRWNKKNQAFGKKEEVEKQINNHQLDSENLQKIFLLVKPCQSGKTGES